MARLVAIHSRLTQMGDPSPGAARVPIKIKSAEMTMIPAESLESGRLFMLFKNSLR